MNDAQGTSPDDTPAPGIGQPSLPVDRGAQAPAPGTPGVAPGTSCGAPGRGAPSAAPQELGPDSAITWLTGCDVLSPEGGAVSSNVKLVRAAGPVEALAENPQNPDAQVSAIAESYKDIARTAEPCELPKGAPVEVSLADALRAWGYEVEP